MPSYVWHSDVMDQQHDLAALGDRVRRRRERLGMSIDTAAEMGPVSPTTWSRVELGRKVRRLSYGAVDRVLKWPEGACMDFLQSGIEPRAVISDDPPTTRQLVDELSDKLKELRTVMDEKLGAGGQRVRNALIDGLQAEIDRSTANGVDR